MLSLRLNDYSWLDTCVSSVVTQLRCVLTEDISLRTSQQLSESGAKCSGCAGVVAHWGAGCPALCSEHTWGASSVKQLTVQADQYFSFSRDLLLLSCWCMQLQCWVRNTQAQIQVDPMSFVYRIVSALLNAKHHMDSCTLETWTGAQLLIRCIHSSCCLKKTEMNVIWPTM